MSINPCVFSFGVITSPLPTDGGRYCLWFMPYQEAVPTM